MKSIKNLTLNVQIQKNSEKGETVPIIQHMNEEFSHHGKSQPNFDSTESTRIQYQKLK